MNDQAKTAAAAKASLVPGRFTWRGLLTYVPAAALAGVGIAWVAEVAQSDFRLAPWLLFPILVGVVLGTLLVLLLRWLQAGHRPTVLAGTVLAGLVAVAGQHYLLFRTAQRLPPEWRAARAAFPEAANRIPPVPTSLCEYLADEAHRGRPLAGGLVLHDRLVWASWALDGLLLLAAAVGVVWPAVRQAYCNRCHTWYRTIRNGRIDGPTVLQIATAAGIDCDPPPKSGRYRLLSCQSGCGLTRLELLWEDDSGRMTSTVGWLTARQRTAVMQAVDEAMTVEQAPSTK